MIIDITKIQSNLFKGPPLSDNHLSKMTNTESAQANSHIIITVQDNHLSNATRYHFFVSQMKKILSKTTTKNLSYKEMGNKHKATKGIKINLCLVIFTLLLFYDAKCV